MLPTIPHIDVCVCTFKRPDLLAVLLIAVGAQKTADLFSYSVVVVDNDAAESGRNTVEAISRQIPCPVLYRVQPVQNIALARNTAVEQSTGQFVAFIDDDECPEREWLLTLLQACERYRAAGVLAPVRPKFELQPPVWLVKTKFFDRPEYSTGTLLKWPDTRTGNALVRKKAIESIEGPFQSVYGAGGEDQDFFRRLMAGGHQFIWCNEAPVYEFVPINRSSVRYMCRRALLRGQNERHTLSLLSISKSVAAMIIYALLMPLLLLCGRHLFIRYLVKFLDHTGKICAALGIKPMGEKYL